MNPLAATRILLRGIGVLLLASLPAMTGCKGFFIPVCQANNDCTTTSTTTPPAGSERSSNSQTPNTGAASSLVYVSNAQARSISGYSVASSAAIQPVAPISTNIAVPSAVAAIPNGKYLYMASTAGSVYAYSIAGNGGLLLGNGGNPVATVPQPVAMSVDPSGKWLLVASSSSQLQNFQIDPVKGTLQPAAQAALPLDAGVPTQIDFTPNRAEVYVSLGTGGIDAFPFDPNTGTLGTRQHTATEKAGISADNAIASDGASKYLFAGEAGVGIRVWTMGSQGALQEVAGSPFASPLATPTSLAVDSTGSYLYVADRMSNRIAGYSIASSGALQPLPSSPFPMSSAAVSLSLDPSGKHLLAVSNRKGFALQTFSFDSRVAGKLDSMNPTITGAGPATPLSMAILP